VKKFFPVFKKKNVKDAGSQCECDPYIFVENYRHCRQEPARLPTTQDSVYHSHQQVSQDRAQELFERHLTRPYQGVSRIEFFVCYLWIPVVGEGVVCFLSGGLGCSWIFTAQAPDDPLSLRAYIEMLWASFHAQDRQWDAYIFVEYFRFCRQETTRLPTTQDSFSLSLQQVSQDRVQELFVRHLTRPYQGV